MVMVFWDWIAFELISVKKLEYFNKKLIVYGVLKIILATAKLTESITNIILNLYL